MATGDEIDYDGTLQAMVAYEIDGKPIAPNADGPLRLAIVSAERNQVTDGHWWVKWLNKLAVKPVEQEWTLVLAGALTEEMDRATFETGAAEGCHGQDWKDAEGNTWTGIPLYLLVGRVDDDNVHEGPAYNRDLAEAGYDVEIVTSGSGTITVSSKTMYYNKQLLVAYRMNGEELPEEYWPLRLVGDGVDAAQMVGGIGEIKALLPAQ
jgi:DMSO/TMAO reductase YedYZ molybdopterin-dependent catalytic subunit